MVNERLRGFYTNSENTLKKTQPRNLFPEKQSLVMVGLFYLVQKNVNKDV
jgi:hypothetical protein